MSSSFMKIIGPNMDKSLEFKYSDVAHSVGYRVAGRINSFKIPKDPRNSLNVRSRYIVFQIFHKPSDQFSITLGIRGDNNQVQKFIFSTSSRKRTNNYMKISVPGNSWVNLCLDLEYIVLTLWESTSFGSLETIEISPTCLIRYVFATPTSLRPEANGLDLPHGVEFTGGIRSQTVTISARVSNQRRSRIPLYSAGPKSKPGTANRPVAKQQPKTAQPDRIERPHLTFPNVTDDPESSCSDSEDDAFSGHALKTITDASNFPTITKGLPQDEEEELELVYIEALDCYYCPSNQQYYQIDD